ncbi:MAG: hypothetical protein LDLANPLL_00037 [Turneriella sp.]|nr:hypothetical protein [Turneriella sp.]
MRLLRKQILLNEKEIRADNRLGQIQTMHEANEGRLLDFQAAMANFTPCEKNYSRSFNSTQGKALLLEPRSIRHQERVEDLFYLLFKRTSG